MTQVKLSTYGGVIQKLLAELILSRRKRLETELEVTYDQIPPREFFDHLAKNPLPRITEESQVEIVEEANRIISFINETDDILNLKRALRWLVEVPGNKNSTLFQNEMHSPSLLQIEDIDEK